MNSWAAPGLGGVLGTCHGLDVPLVFGNLTSGQPAMLIGDPPSPAAQELSDAPSKVTAYPEQTSRLLWQDHTFPALRLLAQ